ncbi:hypothetical protein SAMD00079811_81610 (plasmid) [Scytonema sp. HK-05]|uniref:hypothetical protein n=1 Tax=Scytonema sp. HK-05 TaxID=1137095 RepID=UPI000936A435|nr:hypothetical protein [Scytonema sp. HK-05]OKH58168.1 hypothetical protein NIES2130_15870 [Scytonema sp. HK-05]BAY50532.1 hypothetical protein SAMD00079811_81610 [Scytonema sp. HK-05]
MTSFPLIQSPTDIVSLLTLEGNLKISEILAETNIEDIPQLQESEKAIQKLRKISKQERDCRIKLLQERLYQLSVIQSFQAFEEDYKGYKAHFSINGRGILIKIISPCGDSWEKQTETFTNFQARREFHLIVNENLVKNSAVVQKPMLETNLQPLSDKEKRWQVLKLLIEGERVLYKGRVGIYKGVQECATPSAWVFFEDSQIVEPVNPLELSQENSDDNSLVLNTSSNLNLYKDEKSISSNYLTSCSQPRTTVDLAQIDGEDFLPPIVQWDNEPELSGLPFELEHLENTEAYTLADNFKQPSSISSNLNSKIIPFSPQILEKPLSKKDAEKIITFINSHLRQLKALPKIQKRSNDIIRHYLVLLDEGKGYEHLGFKNMTALLNSDFIQGSRSNLQKQWQAGRIERDSLGVEPGTIPEDHCRKLALLKAQPEQVQKAYINAQKLAGNGRLTAKIVQQAVQEIAADQGIELPPSKPKKKSLCGWHQNLSGTERYYKLNLCGVEHSLQDSNTEVCIKLEKVAKEHNKTPEKLIVQGLIKLVAQSMELNDSEVLVKAVEVALAEIKTNMAA